MLLANTALIARADLKDKNPAFFTARIVDCIFSHPSTKKYIFDKGSVK